MDADYDVHEIVKVIQNFRLFDAESYQRDYCTSHGEPLALGYYVVSWPTVVQVKRFDKHASFHGPFRLRKDAQAFLDNMQKHNFLLIVPYSKRSLNVPDADLAEA